MSNYIVLDLETIYLPEKKINKIIEIGFVMIHDNKVVDKYSRLINPGAKINHFVKKLTSITNSDIKNAPFFEDIYQEFLPLFKGHIIVAHQAHLDMKTINDELNLLDLPSLENKTIDTVELSKIMLPEEASYKLTELAISLNIKFDMNNAHRALMDAELTTTLFLLLKEKLFNLPKNSLYHLKQLLPYLVSDIDHLFEQIAQLENDENIYNYYNDLPFLKPLNFVKYKDELIDYKDFITNIYNEEGLLNKIYENYVYRKDQVKISEVINEQFDKKRHAVIEAATGIGKSIGYLIPAIYESVQNEERIIISTHTTQLQSQLMYEDIANLKKVLPISFNVQILKGKKNYIDIKRFYRFMKNKRNDTYPLVILKAKLIVWLTETETGLFSDVNIEPNMNQYLFEIETLERENPYSFYNFALKKSYTADIVLVNHALLISDLNTEELLIPNYKKVIIDEAHQFKNLMIENENLLIASIDFNPFLNYLIKTTGYYELELLQKEIYHLIDRALNEYIVKQEHDNIYLYSSENQSNETKILIVEDYKTILGYFELSINKLTHKNELNKVIINRFKSFKEKIDNIIINLNNNNSLFIKIEKNNNKIDWFMYSQINKNNENILNQLYKNKDSVIYLSATLAIRNDFNYMLSKLKMAKDTYTLKLSTPFDLSKQTKLIVPNDFPPIKNEKAYLAALSELIYSVNLLSNGRMLVLFTSYQMLKDAYDLLSDFLDDSTTLLAQGVTHSNREQLIHEFVTNQPAILLGTASFWEGVDIKGDVLSCLILTRLPFQQINDPTFKIEAERLEKSNANSFFEYALPEAVLKFRQGVGRLIRNESDKGHIFVLDNRLKESNYKKFFIESIYPIETKYYNTKEIIEDVEKSIFKTKKS